MSRRFTQHSITEEGSLSTEMILFRPCNKPLRRWTVFLLSLSLCHFLSFSIYLISSFFVSLPLTFFFFIPLSLSVTHSLFLSISISPFSSYFPPYFPFTHSHTLSSPLSLSLIFLSDASAVTTVTVSHQVLSLNTSFRNKYQRKKT